MKEKQLLIKINLSQEDYINYKLAVDAAATKRGLTLQQFYKTEFIDPFVELYHDNFRTTPIRGIPTFKDLKSQANKYVKARKIKKSDPVTID